MAARLILHIGTEKTGSTAIQRFLNTRRDWLWQQGCAVPRTLGPIEHRRFPLFFYQTDQRDDLTSSAGLDPQPDEERSARIAGWQREFEDELSEDPDRTWILSSEHIHSRILHRDSCMSLLSTFANSHFDDICVLVYLREPLSAALSLWSTAVLNGAPLHDLPMPEDEYWNRLCCHRSTLERLERWFPGHFQPRLFTPEQWKDGDIIQDFAEATGIALPADYRAEPQRANASLSWLSLALIARLNREGRPARDLVKAIRESFDHLPAPTARTWQRRAYAEAYAESNAWMHHRYFPAQASLFEPAIQ